MPLVGSSVPCIATDVTLDPSSIPGNTVSEETVTVTGADTAMIFNVNAPSLEAGLVILPPQVRAANVVTIIIWNTTSSPINPASQTFYLASR